MLVLDMVLHRTWNQFKVLQKSFGLNTAIHETIYNLVNLFEPLEVPKYISYPKFSEITWNNSVLQHIFHNYHYLMNDNNHKQGVGEEAQECGKYKQYIWYSVEQFIIVALLQTLALLLSCLLFYIWSIISLKVPLL